MKSTRKRGLKPKQKGGLKPLYIFFFIFGTCALTLFAEMSKPVYPSPPSSSAGLTPVAIGNAGPDPITVLITSESGKVSQVNIPRCPTCKTLVLPDLEPKDCPANTVYKEFALSPGTHQVQVSSSNVFNKPKGHRSRLVVKKDEGLSRCFFRTATEDGSKRTFEQ
jgi:hypothetical protein